jgi:hypothetical protein
MLFYIYTHFRFGNIDHPFPDPPGLLKPSVITHTSTGQLNTDGDPLDALPEEEEERIRRAKAAAASALTLEMVGVLPFANVRPPENVLFFWWLNNITRGPKRGTTRSGFVGRDDLEMTRRYRDEAQYNKVISLSIFALHMQYHASKEIDNAKPKTIFYLCSLWPIRVVCGCHYPSNWNL